MTAGPVPAPRANEVLVKVAAVSLNYRDLAYAERRFFPDAPAGLVPVSDAAGVVEAIGPDVTGWKVGDRVNNAFNPEWAGGAYVPTAEYEYGTAQDGWLTEYRIAPDYALVEVPPSLSMIEAATLPCAAVTAWTALGGQDFLRPGMTVLTQGTGVVSLAAVQLAKLLGARVIATTSSAERAKLLRSIGADAVIDYVDEPEWGIAAHAASGGAGVDLIVEVGGAATFAQSLQAGNKAAEIAVIGFLEMDDWNVDFRTFFGGGWAAMRRIRVGSRQDAHDLSLFLAQRPFAPVIDSVFPFDRAVQAWRRLASRKATGNITIEMDAN